MRLHDIYDFSTYNGIFLDDELLQEMSSLYSIHYGVWGDKHPNAGKHVKLSCSKLKEGFITDNTSIVIARTKNTKQLVGYAIAIKSNLKDKLISWVTQFVVHSDHRNKRIGMTLLYSLWGESHFFAWGIVTSNPYAIRALEKATHRRCDIQKIKKHHHELIQFSQSENIFYISQDENVIIDDFKSVVNTKFYVDHSEIQQKIKSISSEECPWVFGDLEEGFEWFAFTFNDQAPFPLSSEEINLMLDTSDEVTKEAYSRMNMGNQAWTKHYLHEVDWILKETNVSSNSKVLDLGCGNGRHSIELSRRGYNVTAIDYNNFGNWHKEHSDIRFIQRDIRNIKKDSIDKDFELVLCLYDVIGTYENKIDNDKIIREIYDHLIPGGYAVISVMNIDFLLSKNPQLEDVKNNWNILLNLSPETAMQQTGNIFDKNKIIIDKNSYVCYRKEQFSGSKENLFNEFIVRDKRYTKNEIVTLLKHKNFEIIDCRYVRAGNWNEKLSKDTGKEILIVCKKNKLAEMEQTLFTSEE